MKNGGEMVFGRVLLPPIHGNTKRHESVCEVLCFLGFVVNRKSFLTTKATKFCAEDTKKQVVFIHCDLCVYFCVLCVKKTNIQNPNNEQRTTINKQ